MEKGKKARFTSSHLLAIFRPLSANGEPVNRLGNPVVKRFAFRWGWGGGVEHTRLNLEHFNEDLPTGYKGCGFGLSVLNKAHNFMHTCAAQGPISSQGISSLC